jgi:hypothetical protein
MADATCQFCKWWAPGDYQGNATVESRENIGRHMNVDCRRHAPIVREIRSGNYIQFQNWPQTNGASWCGDFEQVPE